MFILFGMFYITTRSILIALGLLIVYYTFLYILLNENHPWNMLSPKWLATEGFSEAEKKSSIDLYYENMSKLAH